MIERITTKKQLEALEEMVWKECSRFSLHDFCEEGGFSCDAFQDMFDLAEFGFETRNAKSARKKDWGNQQ